MGNSLAKPLKTKAGFMMEFGEEKFGKDFDKNKKTINDMKLPISKKTRNRLSGYIVRTSKRKDKEE